MAIIATGRKTRLPEATSFVMLGVLAAAVLAFDLLHAGPLGAVRRVEDIPAIVFCAIGIMRLLEHQRELSTAQYRTHVTVGLMAYAFGEVTLLLTGSRYHLGDWNLLLDGAFLLSVLYLRLMPSTPTPTVRMDDLSATE